MVKRLEKMTEIIVKVKEEKMAVSESKRADFFLNDITEATGDIPLIKLRRMTAARDIKATILVKPEFLNPSGSVKDRMAVYILDQAIARGELKPGGTIVEATSGNTGASVAMFAAANNFKAIFTIPRTNFGFWPIDTEKEVLPNWPSCSNDA